MQLNQNPSDDYSKRNNIFQQSSIIFLVFLRETKKKYLEIWYSDRVRIYTKSLSANTTRSRFLILDITTYEKICMMRDCIELQNKIQNLNTKFDTSVRYLGS